MKSVSISNIKYNDMYVICVHSGVYIRLYLHSGFWICSLPYSFYSVSNDDCRVAITTKQNSK